MKRILAILVLIIFLVSMATSAKAASISSPQNSSSPNGGTPASTPSADNFKAGNISPQTKMAQPATLVSPHTITASPVTSTPQKPSSLQTATFSAAAAPTSKTPGHIRVSPQETVCCPIGSGTSQPWSAGYMDQPFSLASEVRVQVSFLNTPQSVIPSGNYIRVGMMAQSQTNGGSNNCIQACDTLDWANFAWVHLASTGPPVVLAEVDTSPGYFESSIQVFSTSWSCTCYSASDFATLTMRWNGGVLEWLVAINGVDHGVFATYTPYSYQQKVFHVGAQNFSVCYNLLACTVKFFQYGIFGKTPIANSGFQVFIQSPQYMTDGTSTWNDVTKSTSTDGADALVDKQYAVGGEAYIQAKANYCKNDGTKPYGQILFTESPNFLLSGVLLWDSSCSRADFSFSESPSFISMNPGQSLCCTLFASLGTLNSYTGGVAVSLTGLPSWCVITSVPGPTLLTSEPPVLGTAAAFSISLTTYASCPTSLTFIGTLTSSDGIIGHTTSFTLRIPGYLRVSASPSSNMVGGQPSTIAIQPSDNQQNLAISLTTNLGRLSSPTCTTGTDSICRVILWSSSSYGTATVTATAAGYNSGSTTVTFTDYSISATSPPAVAAGTSATSTITVTGLNGFTGTVSLADTLPANLTCNAIAPASITGSGTATVTCSSTVAASYTLTVTGTSGFLSRSATVTFTFGDFIITERPTSQIIPLGSEQQTVITVTSQGSWSGTVNLVASVPSGLGCWFAYTLTNSASVSVPAGSQATQWLTCTGGPAGAYTITTTGTSGSSSHSVALQATITDFSMTAPPSLVFQSGSSKGATITLASLSGFSGAVTLAASTPAGISVSCPANVIVPSGGTAVATCSFSSSTPGTYTVTIIGSFRCGNCYYNGLDSHSVTITATVLTPKYTLTFQGYDYDGGLEETLKLNNLLLAQLPATDSPQNAGIYVSYSLDITSLVVKGTNTLTFTHANWDCGVVDSTKNIVITDATGAIIFSDATVRPLSCTQSITYTFTV